MSKKSVIRRLTKRIPQSPELSEALNIEDAAEFSADRAAVTALPRIPSPPAIPSPPPIAARASTQTALDLDQEDDPPPGAASAEPVAETQEANGQGYDPRKLIDPKTADQFLEQLDGALTLTRTLEDLEEAWNEADPEGTFDGDDALLTSAFDIKKAHVERVEAIPTTAPNPPSPPPVEDRPFPGDTPLPKSKRS